MLELGEEIEIRGEKGTVCFLTTYNNENYACVAFPRETTFFDIYKYIIIDDNLKVKHVDDEETLNNVLPVFVEQGLDTIDKI